MNGLFCAESVVVVGVSESTDNLGKNVVANLVNFGYPGKIYAVGPRGGEVFGHPGLSLGCGIARKRRTGRYSHTLRVSSTICLHSVVRKGRVGRL